MTENLDDSTLVYHPDLFTQDYRVLMQTTCPCGNENMRGQESTSNLGRKRRNNRMRTRDISAIDLQNDNRPYFGFFCANHWIQVTQNHIPATYGYHRISPRAKRFS
jgi:hypothetical protein